MTAVAACSALQYIDGVALAQLTEAHMLAIGGEDGKGLTMGEKIGFLDGVRMFLQPKFPVDTRLAIPERSRIETSVQVDHGRCVVVVVVVSECVGVTRGVKCYARLHHVAALFCGPLIVACC